MYAELGQVVASRDVVIDDRRVTIEVGVPRRLPGDPDNVYCPVEIRGLSETDPWRQLIAGVDSVQALLLALTMAGERLNAEPGHLTFLGEPTSGLPTTTVITDTHWTVTLRHRIAAESPGDTAGSPGPVDEADRAG